VDNGATPYTWSLAPGSNPLPSGLSLDSATGIISGTPTEAGTFTITLQVTDNQKLSDTSPSLTLTVDLPAAPTVDFSGLPNPATPKQQVKWQFALKGSYPLPITVQLDLAFTPASSLPDDPSIQFSTNGRTTTFTINPGDPLPVIMFQTGTVAGSITITATLSTQITIDSKATTQIISPNPAPSYAIGVPSLKPTITNVTASRTSDGFDVIVVGFATPRQVATANFQFGAGSGASLQTTQLSVPVQSLFDAWYQDASSAQWGSQFTYTQHFQIQGTSTAVTSVTVTLGNAVGTSDPMTTSF
jgi:hypothetical protein